MSTSLAAPVSRSTRWSQFYALTKPRVVQLIVFCALIGMLLAQPGWPDWRTVVLASLGIWLVAGAAAAFNCIVEQHIDARMQRTAWRPTAKGQLTNTQTLVFSGLLCAAGCVLLVATVNALTMWLTLATFVGYAVIYTVVLKPLTPQNIVIGGASGAMPPVLGWAAMRGDTGPEAWMLFLIIFLWTPPHTWALALFRRQDYENVGVPMLPVVVGEHRTKVQMVVYTALLVPATFAPVAIQMSGWLYALTVLGLNAGLIWHMAKVWKAENVADAKEGPCRPMFFYTILYLFGIFLALLADRTLFFPVF